VAKHRRTYVCAMDAAGGMGTGPLSKEWIQAFETPPHGLAMAGRTELDPA
jgi:hypothetical protein